MSHYELNDRETFRFWAYVPKSDGCWEWAGNVWTGGYGRFFLKGHYVPAHRVAYELCEGEIPEGLQMDHLCRNRICVNPEHLEPVTPSENQRRGYLAGRVKSGVSKGTAIGGALLNRAKTHCPAGHEYSDDNVYLSKRGQRHCVTCRNARNRALYQQRVR